ncbi:MAG: hypothetical protein IH932_04475 [Thaumarchaeota archaeon]|nr:hypothetical protein [Nitrososphaerota archaeon]
MITKKQLEKEIEKINKIDDISFYYLKGNLQATLTQTNKIIELIEKWFKELQITSYSDDEEGVSDGVGNLVRSCDKKELLKNLYDTVLAKVRMRRIVGKKK